MSQKWHAIEVLLELETLLRSILILRKNTPTNTSTTCFHIQAVLEAASWLGIARRIDLQRVGG